MPTARLLRRAAGGAGIADGERGGGAADRIAALGEGDAAAGSVAGDRGGEGDASSRPPPAFPTSTAPSSWPWVRAVTRTKRTASAAAWPLTLLTVNRGAGARRKAVGAVQHPLRTVALLVEGLRARRGRLAAHRDRHAGRAVRVHRPPHVHAVGAGLRGVEDRGAPGVRVGHARGRRRCRPNRCPRTSRSAPDCAQLPVKLTSPTARGARHPRRQIVDHDLRRAGRRVDDLRKRRAGRGEVGGVARIVRGDAMNAERRVPLTTHVAVLPLSGASERDAAAAR